MLATLLPLQADAVPPGARGNKRYYNHKDFNSELKCMQRRVRCHLTCYRVGGRGAGGGAGRADHAGVTAAGSADTAGAGAAVAAPLPALPGAAGPLPGAVLSDVVTHLMTTHL